MLGIAQQNALNSSVVRLDDEQLSSLVGHSFLFGVAEQNLMPLQRGRRRCLSLRSCIAVW
jgi:hypothetical protein